MGGIEVFGQILYCLSRLQYTARWKIKAGFKELKREIGSAETQTRNLVAVKTTWTSA